MTLHILEHPTPGYRERTQANADSADVTIAIAVDYSTAGEKLTRNVAGDKYLQLSLNAYTSLEMARILYRHCRDNNCRSINVAGNGIYTLEKHCYSQPIIDMLVLWVLRKVHTHHPLTAIRSGGQTGVDLAGARAGYELGIETTVLLPKGFKQRYADGVDYYHTAEQIRNQITGGKE